MLHVGMSKLALEDLERHVVQVQAEFQVKIQNILVHELRFGL